MMARKLKPVPVRIVHDEPIGQPYREKDRLSISLRQIENGWIMNRHGFKDGKHFDEEIFTPSEPTFASTPRRAPPAPRPARGESRDPEGANVRQKSSPRSAASQASDMVVPRKATPKSPLNVPSDAPLPRPRPRGESRENRLMKIKL
jgi:hypothetical protein